MKNKFFLLLAVVVGAVVFASCEDEEKMGQSLKGTWEGDMGVTRTLRGKTIKPMRTVIHFDQETNTSTVGSGYMVEYYNLPGMEAVYYHLSWNTWTRKNGNVGLEFSLTDNPSDKFTFYDDFSMTDAVFEGKYPDSNGTDIHFKLKRITTAPDVSNVKIWGFYDKMDTWSLTTYEGFIDLKRSYQDKTYTPTKVSITFDSDPMYNESSHNYFNGYMIEQYADAPWGSYLADKMEYWSLWSNEMRIRTSDNTEYNFYDIKVNENELTGEALVDYNTFYPFTLKRVSTPDMSAFQQWGITSRLK